MLDREKRITQREISKIKSKIKKLEPLPTSYRYVFLHKMLKKNSCGENFPNPIVLYDQSVTSLGEDLKKFSIGKQLTKGSRERLSVKDSIMVRDSYGNLPSLKCINYLRKHHNKVILLVGSDRVEAFKRYNEEKMNELFGVGNALILQSGGERGDSGEGDKALDELEVLFANMSLDDDNSGESKVPVREDYSGSLSRKKALGNKNDIKQFLHMIDYTPGDNLDDIYKLIIKIRQANRVSILGISKKIRAAVNEIDDDGDFDKFAEQFVESGEERKKLRQQRGFGRTKKRKKRKRCSKKRLKKNMICHKGTKKKLRKLRKLTKKLKIRLTRCSKKRLKKWKVKKSRKKM